MELSSHPFIHSSMRCCESVSALTKVSSIISFYNGGELLPCFIGVALEYGFA